MEEKEVITIDRDTIVERLLESWQAHYECMADAELVKEFKEYLSPTKPHNIVIHLIDQGE
jgi:5'(3')-deoxyribonucleotidase